MNTDDQMSTSSASGESNIEWGAADSTWISAVDQWDWHAKYRTSSDGKRQLVSWFKAGSCPRCGGSMIVEQNRGWAESVDGMTVAPSPTKEKDARCNCSGAHDGRPTGVNDGCGASGEIRAAEPKKAHP
jgi:hypothetical protein